MALLASVLLALATLAGVAILLPPGVQALDARTASYVGGRRVVPGALKPVTDADGFAGVCLSHYYGPGDRPFLPRMVEAGSRHDRVDFRWDVIHANGYAAHDTLVDDEVAAGVDLTAILWATPADLRVDGCDPIAAGSDSGACPPQGLYNDWTVNDFNGNQWAAFVYETVFRYRGRVRTWEIWNEPDWSWAWLGSEADYAQLLKVAYRAVQSADPSATVLFGGLVYWSDPGYLSRVLELLYADPHAELYNGYFDVLSLHLYGRSSSAYDVVNAVFVAMADHGACKPIWLTEVGVSVYDGTFPGRRETYSARETEAADFLLQSYANARAAGAERYYWFRAHDDSHSGPTRVPQGMVEHFGLFHNETYTRPAYVAYQVATSYLLSPTMVTSWNYSEGVRRVTLWGTPRGKISVLWNRLPQTLVFTYPATLPQALLIDRQGQTALLTPSLAGQGSAAYQIPLPAATAFLTGSDGQRDYFIGGETFLVLEVDTASPTATIDPLPASVFSHAVSVTWQGVDAVEPLAAGIWAYDVQIRRPPESVWESWQRFTVMTSTAYRGVHQEAVCFRVRAWDRAGNSGLWSTDETCTTFDLSRSVRITVGRVLAGFEPLDAVRFRLLDRASTTVVSETVGAAWAFSGTLIAGDYALWVIPLEWGTPPPGFLPCQIVTVVCPGSGRQEIVYPELSLLPHNTSRFLPLVLL